MLVFCIQWSETRDKRSIDLNDTTFTTMKTLKLTTALLFATFVCGATLAVAQTATEHAVKSPRDVASGQATGKRMHKPFVIIKEWEKSSPLLMVTDGVNTLAFAKCPESECQPMKFRGSFFDIFTEISLQGKGGSPMAGIEIKVEKIEMKSRKLISTSTTDDKGQIAIDEGGVHKVTTGDADGDSFPDGIYEVTFTLADGKKGVLQFKTSDGKIMASDDWHK